MNLKRTCRGANPIYTYDPIAKFSVDNKEGATEKPWISESTDVDDCSSCKDNESCGNTITVNIDLSNVRIAELLLSENNC